MLSLQDKALLVKHFCSNKESARVLSVKFDHRKYNDPFIKHRDIAAGPVSWRKNVSPSPFMKSV